MMKALYHPNFVILNTVCLCQRRITNGKVVELGKKYMVYLVNSQYSDNQPDDWLCGGVLISTLHVLTAAACLTEVSHIYVIAGYKKLVSGKNIRDDPCTSTRKQRIVKVIIPKAFNESVWMRFDIGIGVVERHYDFFDMSYRKVCSYEPEAIPISYDKRLDLPGKSVFSLGWGATNSRAPGIDVVNSDYLMEAHAITTNSSFCKQQFPKNIEYFFLCTYDAKTLEDVIRMKKGKKQLTSLSLISSRTSKKSTLVIPSKTRNTSKTTTTKESAKTTEIDWLSKWVCGDLQFHPNNTPEECLDMDNVISYRRKTLVSNDSVITPLVEISDKNKTFDGIKSNTTSRKHGTGESDFGGICQNDHGGPLVAIVGQQERLIGIALNSVYNKKYQCNGPSLYFSTARAKDLINCMLSTRNEKFYVFKRCKAMNFEVKKYSVTWPTCEDGSCENATMELIQPEPLLPPVSPIPPVLPKPSTQPKTVMPLSFITRQTYTPIHHNTRLPSTSITPIFIKVSPYESPVHNLPLHYTYYTPFYDSYYTRPPYNVELLYRPRNYQFGMPHIPSNLGADTLPIL